MQITYISRASWFKIRTNNTVIHIDPGYTGYFETQGIPVKELEEKADIVLVSHFHKDHLQPKALSMIATAKTAIFAPKSCAERIEQKTTIVIPNEEYTVPGLKIKTVDAYNTPYGHSTRKVHHKGDFVGYLITVDGKTIYHAGDTDFIPEMKTLGSVDVALLPIGGTFVMDTQEAANAVVAIKPNVVIPMHMSHSNPQDFKRLVGKHSNTEVVILNLGGTYSLD